jgi:PAS domain S-box-containing protein
MENFLKIPDYQNEELNTRARTIVYTSIGIIILSIIFIATIPFYAPNFTDRYVKITGAIAAICFASILLVQRRKLRSAGLLIITLLWLVVTFSTITAGSISAPIMVGYMIVILLGGLVLSYEAGVITTLICIATGIAIAMAETAGLLREPISFSPAIRIGAYVFIFLVVMTFQTVNAIFISELIKKSKRSESRYQSLLENIPTTTYINSLNDAAKTEYVSPQVERLLGYSPKSFTDDPLLWIKILHPDDEKQVMSESERTSQTQEVFELEYRIIAKDKRIVWVKDEANLVRDEEGTPIYWLGVWTDITDRKQVENEQLDLVHGMARRTIQLQTAAEVASAATSTLDIDELLPNVVELIRKHFEYYYVGIFLVDELSEWAELRAATGKMGEQMIETQHRLKLEDSSMIGWSITHKEARIALDVGEDAVRLVNPNLPLTRSEMALPLITHGEVIGAMTIQSEEPAAFSHVDITALQTMADQVANAIKNARLFTDKVNLNSELEAQNEELERYTYTVSHDLRSPLVTIRGFLGYLRQAAETGDLQRHDKDLSRISNAVDKMQTLLNELLELSRVGRIADPPEDVSFEEIVGETADLLTGQMEAGNVRLNIVGELPHVHVDRIRISEVVQNLISNAAKFMGDQPRPTIEVGMQGYDIDGKPILYIRDNGIGIHPDFHERIFGLFNRLDPAIEGTGVGLTLVKRIIEINGGRIWLESEPGRGSTFLLTLPASILAQENKKNG